MSLRSYFRNVRKLYTPPTVKDVHGFWKDAAELNAPEMYIQGSMKSQFVVNLLAHYASPSASVCELGCNVGRNLDALHRAGFSTLHGIEINADATALMNLTFPEMAEKTTVQVGPLENVLPELPDGAFDAVFTMAVLEHIHYDSDWVFKHIARVTGKVLITIEDELASTTWRHFPRDYGKIFRALGMVEKLTVRCEGIEGLGPHFRCRVFMHEPINTTPQTLTVLTARNGAGIINPELDGGTR